jgi:putative hydrolase of the HAD superfamily
MAIRALFFDLDDTLIDDRAAVRHGAQTLFGAHAHQLPEGVDVYDLWQEAFDQVYPRYLRGEMTLIEQRRARIRRVFAAPQLADAEADARYALWWDGYRAGAKVYPDVIPALDRLAHLPLGIITNGGLTEGKLRAAGIHDRFSVVVDPDCAGAKKTDPRMFLAACRLIGVMPETAMHVGDHPDHDARAALRAGLQARWLNRLSRPGSPDLPTITTLDQLTDG